MKVIIKLTVILVLFNSSYLFSQDTRKTVTLEESIQYALENNKTILSAQQKLREAKARVTAAFSGFIPSITLSGAYTQIEQAQTISLGAGMPEMVFRGKETYMCTTTVRQNIFTWGRVINSYRLARANKRAGEEEYNKAKNEVVFETTKAFYNLLLAKEMIKLSEESYRQMEKHLRQVKVLYENGIVSKLDLLRAQVQLSNLKPQVTRAKNGLILAEDYFKMTTGIPSKTSIELDGEFVFESVDVNVDELIKTALENRPDIKILKEREKMTKRQIGIARAGNKPSIVAMYNLQHMNPYLWEDKWGDEWNIMVQANFPIFTGFATYGNVKAAKAQSKQVKYGLEQLKEATVIEVKQVCMNLQQEKETIQSQKENIKQAEEALKIAEERYRRGIISNLEYMDTQLAFTQAKTNYFQAITNYAVAKAQLLKVTGHPQSLVK